MRILLVGDFSENRDEGYKNVSHALADGLLNRGQRLVYLDVKHLRDVGMWRQVGEARPDVIHIIAQPTYFSLIVTGLLHRLWPSAKIVLSALVLERFILRRERNLMQLGFMGLAGTDLILVQNEWAESLLKCSGFNVAPLPNGVDLVRFRPVCPDKKSELRRHLGLDVKRPLVLHVGHLEPARNLMVLAPLLAEEIQVVIAGSLCMGSDTRLIKQLEQTGFHLLKGFQPQVERLYMSADCYVFPVLPGNSLSVPLSVLEAMSCNLKVATTPFQGLLNLFPEGGGLVYLDDPSELCGQVYELLQSSAPVGTRGMVARLSWETVVNKLIRYYEEMLAP